MKSVKLQSDITYEVSVSCMVGKISRMINILAGSSELSVNIPERDGMF